MGTWSRRSVLGSISVLPFAGLAGIGRANAANGDLSLPDGPMILHRTLRRGLRDGIDIVVQRVWTVSFFEQPGGVRITGNQLSATVDAPPEIAAIAEIERERDTSSMFPIELDGNGRIIGIGYGEPQSAVTQAVRAAEKLIAGATHAGSEREQALRQLSQIRSAGGSMLGRLPPDLFFPVPTDFREVQPVALPDGSQGEFELHYRAAAVAAGGWLEALDRTVITRLAGSERQSAESWTMRQA